MSAVDGNERPVCVSAFKLLLGAKRPTGGSETHGTERLQSEIVEHVGGIVPQGGVVLEGEEGSEGLGWG